MLGGHLRCCWPRAAPAPGSAVTGACVLLLGEFLGMRFPVRPPGSESRS